MPFSIRRVRTKTSEIGNEKVKVLYAKHFIVDSKIDNQVREINVTEVWDVREFYDCSSLGGEENILKKIADRLRFRIGALHHDDEGYTG